MANVARYLRGPQCIIEVPVESATVIEIGDFVCLSVSAGVSAYAIQPSDIADAGTAGQNRDAGADIFIGIAQTASAVGETDPVQVDISTISVYKLTQKTAALAIVGEAQEIYASADHCEDQTVVAGTTDPIAICVKAKAATGTDIECTLLPSTLLHLVNT